MCCIIFCCGRAGGGGFFQTGKGTVAKDGAGRWERDQESMGVSWGAETTTVSTYSTKIMLPWDGAPCCSAFLLGDKREYEFFNKG